MIPRDPFGLSLFVPAPKLKTKASVTFLSSLCVRQLFKSALYPSL